MNKKSTLIFSLLTLVAFFVLTGFNKEKKELPLDIIKKEYHSELEAFQQSISNLLLTAKKIDSKSILELQDNFKKTRLAYKKIEHIIAYLEADGVKMHINGAPLPKLEPNVPEISVKEPSGLQTIDEIVFSENPLADQKHLIQLIENLLHEYKILKNIQKQRYFSDRQVFEAMRFQLVRILSLGITGFDTPASLHALPEAATSLTKMQSTFQTYLAYLENTSPELTKTINTTFSEAIEFLKTNDDFDSFDRLTFVKQYLNPLFKLVLNVQLELGVETFYEVSNTKTPVNYLAKNIFDKDFLNKYYFIRLNQAQDSKALQELGRTLFFDPILSQNNERACASCHHPEKGFTDGVDKSVAFDFKGKINRNAPTLINSIYADRFFYDLRADEFDLQVEHVIHAHDEFNTDYSTIVEKLSKSQDYQVLFQKAFPNQQKGFMNASAVNTAIVAYVKELVGYSSELDLYLRNETEEYPEAARRGFNLFMGKAACGTCHFAPTFSGLVPPDFHENEAEVIGVPATNDSLNIKLDNDLGKSGSGRIKEIAPYHQFAFKTTTVRNVELTAPYMHNGVYNSLEEVVDFYNKGGGAGMGIDLEHQTLPFDKLNLTWKEQQDIIAFMKTLTDDISALQDKPKHLPKFPKEMNVNDRVIGGQY